LTHYSLSIALANASRVSERTPAEVAAVEKRLGRGLGTLLGQSDELDDPKKPTELALERIRPNPFQPRRHFDEASLHELAQSLRSHGVLQPIVVRDTASGFELIAGERRWRAARIAGLAMLPALIRTEVSDGEMLELALIENVQREDLNAIERAQGFRAMLQSLSLTQEEVAKRVGIQRASVANHLRLLDLPLPVQEAVSKGLLSMGHAKAILALPGDNEQVGVMERAVREGLSVRQIEELGRERKSTVAGSKGSSVAMITPHQPWIAELEARLRESLGTRVGIQNGRGYRGKIVIEYFDRPGLERLCRSLAPSRDLD
jgi:ParB family transcriptional regulator, chromosome partitioning protein